MDFSALEWNDNIPTGTELLDNWLTELPSHETFGCMDEGSPGAFSEILTDPFLPSGDLFASPWSYDFPMGADMISAVAQSHFLAPSTLSCHQSYVPCSNDFGGVFLPGASFRDIASNTSTFSEAFSPTSETQMSQFSPASTASPLLSWGDILCPAPVMPVALTGETAVPPSAELIKSPAPLRPQPRHRSHHSSRQHPHVPMYVCPRQLCVFFFETNMPDAEGKYAKSSGPSYASSAERDFNTRPC